MVEESRKAGAQILVGRYRPTAKNGMVKDHYAKLGFTRLEHETRDGESLWVLQFDQAVFPPLDHVELVRTR